MSELTVLQVPLCHRQHAGEWPLRLRKKMRTSQQQLIKRKQAPDGTPYAARKRQPVRSKQGRIKREMFAKLRTNRFIKAKGSDSAAVVEFTGKVQRMARVHQFGLKDKPHRKGRDVQYESRPLLGFSTNEEKIIGNVIVASLIN